MKGTGVFFNSVSGSGSASGNKHFSSNPLSITLCIGFCSLGVRLVIQAEGGWRAMGDVGQSEICWR